MSEEKTNFYGEGSSKVLEEIVNTGSTYKTPKALSETLNEVMFEITKKIDRNELDPQALPIIDELFDEIASLADIESKIEEIVSKKDLVKKQAKLIAIDAVTNERKNREDLIRKQHEENDLSVIEEEKKRLKEKANIRKAQQKRQIRMFEEEQAMRETLQKKINEEKFHKREEKLNKDKFNRVKKIRLDNLKHAHDEKQFRLNLMQDEKHQQQKRAHKQKELDFKNAADVKKWEEEQKNLEKTMISESKAMEAKYAADIAKSERRLAEEMQATQIAREDAYNEEMHAIRFKQAIENAKREGKEKAVLDKDIEISKSENSDTKRKSIFSKLFKSNVKENEDIVNNDNLNEYQENNDVHVFNNFNYELEKEKWKDASSRKETIDMLDSVINSVEEKYNEGDMTDTVKERLKELKNYRRLAKTAYTKFLNKNQSKKLKDNNVDNKHKEYSKVINKEIKEDGELVDGK